MIITHSLAEYEEAWERLSHKNDIGFVPTMGALHSGHLSLIERSVSCCKHTVVSIFVNPTQFNDPSDFEKYPRDVDKDISLLQNYDVDILFLPSVKDIYPQEDNRVIDVGGLDKYGEGPGRPGHFNGVAQVVTRLFNIIKPSKALFGEKDFQQLSIIRHFTRALNYPVEIVACDIFRESDGLAMSSRNVRLTHQQRVAAPHIFHCISMAKDYVHSKTPPRQVADQIRKMIDSNKLLKTEYVEIINALTLQPIDNWSDADQIRLWCAVSASPIRLIDNIKLK